MSPPSAHQLESSSVASQRSVQDFPQLHVLGVGITDISMDAALERVESLLNRPRDRAQVIFFVNAHTLNLASDDADYRHVLSSADHVFGDGTGVRWAVRMLYGRDPVDNVNGTDLTPALLGSRSGYRYFLLGHTQEGIEHAARYARDAFPGWTLAGYRHGYLRDDDDAVVDAINAAEPHLLLVGMGNPLQERWIAAHREALRVPVCMGVGGLFAYWAGELDRAPALLRKTGYEWVHLLVRQPRKFRRYVLGNPQFLLRVARSKLQEGGER